ncbi:Hypothetical protein SMAX5B_004037 [Scophthalmus maximus]|uniref:Uncharacterized protein n=1 Tax=Scophthalmus maximus TaxID=52904 RepID=A0A2U9B919_SCOMX|nr:Hypothetical protein SMAX5B_004037 [Scophthalmus maximus]
MRSGITESPWDKGQVKASRLLVRPAVAAADTRHQPATVNKLPLAWLRGPLTADHELSACRRSR